MLKPLKVLPVLGDENQPAYIKAPMIPGHEFIGRVVGYGSAVTGFKIGDRVISEQIVPCWSAGSVIVDSTGCAKNMTFTASRIM